MIGGDGGANLPCQSLDNLLAATAMVRRLLLPTALGIALGVAGAATYGCSSAVLKPVPTDRPVYPMGLALSPDGARLLVGSSNFDFSYDTGAVLLADVAAARAQLLAGNDPAAVVDKPYVDHVLTPEFADRLVFDAAGTSVLFTTRDGNLLHEVEVDGDDVSCGETAICNVAPHALQLSGNDPFDVLVLGDDGVILRGLVSHLGSAQAELFQLDRSKDAGRLTVERTAIDFTRSDATSSTTSSGVRGTVLRAARPGRAATVFAAVERREASTTSTALVGVDLVSFAVPSAGNGGNVAVVRHDITAQIGPRSVRDMLIVDDALDGDDGVDGDDTLVVLLQNPDGIARFDVDDGDNHLTLTALMSSCLQPLGLALAAGDGGARVTRLLVTCHAGNEVVALDPVDLRVTDASRFYGRGPYDVVVDAVNQVAYVGFFLDDSVGVYRLVDDTGAFRLSPIGRLGAALPRPEDGRE